MSSRFVPFLFPSHFAWLRLEGETKTLLRNEGPEETRPLRSQSFASAIKRKCHPVSGPKLVEAEKNRLLREAGVVLFANLFAAPRGMAQFHFASKHHLASSAPENRGANFFSIFQNFGHHREQPFVYSYPCILEQLRGPHTKLLTNDPTSTNIGLQQSTFFGKLRCPHPYEAPT